MQQQDQNPQEQNEQNPEDIGNRSDLGATSTDFNKARLQTVKGTDTSGSEDTSRGSVSASSEMDNNMAGIPSDENDIIDTGYIRSAAFSQDSEPRSDESEEDRDNEPGSDREAS